MTPIPKYLAWLLPFTCLLISCDEEKVLFDNDIQIHKPAEGEIIYTGITYTIRWAPTAWSEVDIELAGPSGNAWTIGKALPNTGFYFWQIPDKIPAGNDYAISITNSRDPGTRITGSGFELRSIGEISFLTDNRDGQVYETVKIGDQWWMAENFNYNCPGSHYYKESAASELIYGRLYTQEAARENSPPGWRLPTDDDWKQLESYLGLEDEELDAFGDRGLYAGLLLGKNGGTGFEARYGGYHNGCVGKDAHKNWESHFWSSSSTYDGRSICRIIIKRAGGVIRLATMCHGGCYVRYVKDAKK